MAVFKKLSFGAMVLLFFAVVLGKNAWGKEKFEFPITPRNFTTSTLGVARVSPYKIPVLVLKYFPLDPNNPRLIDRNIAGTDLPEGTTLDMVRKKVNGLNDGLVKTLENAANNSLDNKILLQKEYLKAIPVEEGTGSRPVDHVKVLTGEGFNICNYVDGQGVKEVWVWMYHSNVAYPVESYQKGPYGGIGNGYMNLPLCNKTYTVYDYNYGRGLGEALEDHGHHIEVLLNNVNSVIYNQFVGTNQAPFGCGNIHCPPNVMSDCGNHQYDWRNESVVPSVCGGSVSDVSCHTWYGATCSDDGGVKYKVWWMQNIPSKWWVWIGDFDGAKARGAGLE